MASSEAITINAPRTQIVHDFDFIPACAPNVNDSSVALLRRNELNSSPIRGYLPTQLDLSRNRQCQQLMWMLLCTYHCY